MSFWRRLGRGLKAAGKGIGKGAAEVAPIAIPLAAATVSPLLGQIAETLLDRAETEVPGPGRGKERLANLRDGLIDVAPGIGAEIAHVAGKPVQNHAELLLALEHHAQYIHHLRKAYAKTS